MGRHPRRPPEHIRSRYGVIAARRNPEPLVLNIHEQEALTGVLLTLWSRDIGAEDDEERKAARSARRNRLRFARRERAPDGKPRQEPTAVEDAAHLKALLGRVRTEAHALQLFVTACASQPWTTMDERFAGRLDEDVRQATLTEVAALLPGNLDDASLVGVDAVLWPGRARRVVRGVKRNPLKTGALFGGAAVVGIATAGVAAPAIGAAIGRHMGLAGAAATSAGLAAIGGGSLASGGLGMAGGTTLIGALGVLGGGGIGAAIGAGEAARHVEAEGSQLQALVSIGRKLDEETRSATWDQARLIELEIARLISERARVTDAKVIAAISDEIARSIRLRRNLGKPRFALS